MPGGGLGLRLVLLGLRASGFGFKFRALGFRIQGLRALAFFSQP